MVLINHRNLRLRQGLDTPSNCVKRRQQFLVGRAEGIDSIDRLGQNKCTYLERVLDLDDLGRPYRTRINPFRPDGRNLLALHRAGELRRGLHFACFSFTAPP